MCFLLPCVCRVPSTHLEAGGVCQEGAGALGLCLGGSQA